MPDSVVSELQRLTDPEGRDVLYIVDVPVSNNSSSVSKSVDLDTLFGSVPSNTHIEMNFSVAGNTEVTNLVISANTTPANSTSTSYRTGQIWSDGSYIYYKLPSKIKRVALSDF